jgi:hypothetical protein
MNTLSVIKIPIMVLAYRDAEAGKLDLDERYTIRPEDRRRGSGLLQTFAPGLSPTYRDLVTQMIVTSDNSATDLLIARLGMDRVNGLLRRRASRRRAFDHGELFEVWELRTQGTPRSPRGGLRAGVSSDEGRSAQLPSSDRRWLGGTTARETSRLLERIHAGEIAAARPATR